MRDNGLLRQVAWYSRVMSPSSLVHAHTVTAVHKKSLRSYAGTQTLAPRAQGTSAESLPLDTAGIQSLPNSHPNEEWL